MYCVIFDRHGLVSCQKLKFSLCYVFVYVIIQYFIYLYELELPILKLHAPMF